MAKRFANTIWVIVVGALLVAGCESAGIPKVDALAVGPDVERLAVESQYSAWAIKAAGGLDAWTKARAVEFDCVVTFYQPDGSYYLTEQHYQVFPWSNSIRISGQEPQGTYVWQLLKGQFAVLRGETRYDGLEVGVDSGCIAEGLLNVITAPARLLDESVEFKWLTEPVRLEGQWYQPIKRMAKAGVEGAASLRDAAFYQKRSNSRIDIVLLGCGIGRSVLVVRGYDYRELEKGGVLLPSKIEMFKADASGSLRQRIIEINVK